MRYLRAIVAVLVAFSAADSAVAELPTTQIPRQHHVWGRFGKGSWKSVQIVTENLDDKGRGNGVTTTETKTTLEKADGEGVALRVESSVEVGGKRFASPAQLIRQGYHGQTAEQSVQVSPLPPAILTIDGRQIPCQVWQVRLSGPDVTRTTKLFYSPTVAPHILRRESTWTETAKPKATQETISEIIMLDMPFRVLDEMHMVAYEKMVYKNSQSVTTTVSVTSPDVPGGVLSSTSKEVDLQGRPIRQSTLEVVEYSAEVDEAQPSQVRRRQLRRERRQNR